MNLTLFGHVSEFVSLCRAVQAPLGEQPVAVPLPEAAMPDPSDPLTLDLGAAVVQNLS